jgi:hypothetical protein
MGPLSLVKDTYLRAKEAVRPHVEKAAALHLHPRSRKAVIRELNFELCSACNLRCKWCSLDSTLRPAMMKLELFEHVLTEIRDEDLYEIKVINLHHTGDALLHPKWRQFLEVIEREKLDRPHFPSVNMLTSATHLVGDKADAILDTQAIDWMRFSVDGGNKEAFERIRVRAKWDEVLPNIHRFLDENERRGRNLRTGIIALFETREPEITEEFLALTRRVTNYMPRLPHNWVGKTELGLERAPAPPQGLCSFVLFQVVVLVDGKITLCCADLNAEGVVGDLGERSLYDIFRGPERAAVITAMREKRRRDLPFCGTCDQA